MLFATGALLAWLRPVLDGTLVLESILWTLRHPTASLTYGHTPRLLLWPPWLLLLLLLLLLAAQLGLLPAAAASPAPRVALTAIAGGAAGLVVCGALLPLERTLYLLTAASTALA